MSPSVTSPDAVLKEDAGESADLMAAAESSLGFWENPLDDEDWNGGTKRTER